MRVSGARAIEARVVGRPKDHVWPLRLFVGVYRFCMSLEEAVELADELVDAVDALRDGRDFDGNRISSTPRSGGHDRACRCGRGGGRNGDSR